MKAGFDFGSKNISASLINDSSIIKTFYIPHKGDIKNTFAGIIDEIKAKHYEISAYGICGSIDFTGIKTIDSILASVEANKFLKTGCKNIISIGCESYSLIILDDNYNYIEHSVNPICASGTGSFIDHQAERLNLTIEELSELSYSFSGKAPSIATRCAVFAKSDIIHSQAKGYSIDAIAAGLCEGMASSIVSNLLKGRNLDGDVLIIGGVSLNKKITQEISKILGVNIKTSIYGTVFNSIGAAVLSEKNNFEIKNLTGIISKSRITREQLVLKKDNYPDFTEDKTTVDEGVEITIYNKTSGEDKIYIGIDIGSTSTKAILLNDDEKIIAGFYTKTAGSPLDAVIKIFKKIKKVYSGKTPDVLGVGTTGSGRKLIKSVINADMEINEITAHAKGAVYINPDVDAIIEIGGQDSKFTRLKNGEVISSNMNYVCAAGTGSFIEEQAIRLGISLDDISGLAENRISPLTSDRCTVYMERDLNIYLNEGFSPEEIITAVLYSVKDNYLSKVSGKTDLGDVIFFQGATAKNRALVSVFENELKKPIIVSKYCHLTGALGVAVLMKKNKINNSKFRGMNFTYKTYEEECNLCINKCNLNIYEINGKKTAWGLKCGRDYEDKKAKSFDRVSYFDREYKNIFINETGNTGTKTIGIPKALYLYEYYPLFKYFFESLGYKVIIEEASEGNMKDGKKIVNSDFCAPIILTHGLLESLNKKGTDFIFFPTIINEQSFTDENIKEQKYYEKERDAYFCFYSEYAPTVLSNLTGINLKDKIISPKIKFNNKPIDKVGAELGDCLKKYLNINKSIIKDNFIKAYNKFKEKKVQWKNLANEIIDKTKNKPIILFLGRPYTLFEKNLNLGIPEKFIDRGFDIIYQSMIDFNIEKEDYSSRFNDRMHWHYGQEIISSCNFAVKNKNIYPVFLTCFRCSPDAYLINYVKDIMNKNNKPYLIIQLDEHTNDAGYETRIDAGIETIKNHFNGENIIFKIKNKNFVSEKILKDYKVLIPYLSPVISELQKYAFISHGYDAEVLPLNEKIINTGYKYATGTECMPNVAISGSLIDFVKREKLNPEKTILFMPTVCMGCNFNQFGVLIDLACEYAGIRNIKISNSNAKRSLEELPKGLNVNLLEVNIVGSLLYKLFYRFKPYEEVPGLTDKCFNDSYNIMKDHLSEKKSLLSAAKKIRVIFEENFKIDIPRKPRIAILGDIYVKYNIILNQDIYSLIDDLDCEILIPSFSETVLHFIDADVRENNLDVIFKKGLIFFEKRFENVFSGILDDSFEPNIDEIYNAIIEYGINHYIAGETSINVGRALYYIKHKLVDAIVHLNPVFCCPGVVSSSIFRKIQKQFNIPIIDLFYDGTNKPNKLIIPELYYLKKTQNA